MIKLNNETQEKIIKQLKIYFREELDIELASFPAQFLLDFFLEEIGSCIYNQAIEDVHKVLSEKFLYITDDLYLLSKEEKY
ncbi:MAG: DUF2164 domain-containing protein [Acinetobacter sp.]